jgi:hypothetical protein
VTERGAKHTCCLLPSIFNLRRDSFTNEVLEIFGGFKIRGQIIFTVKYADNFVILKETIL